VFDKCDTSDNEELPFSLLDQLAGAEKKKREEENNQKTMRMLQNALLASLLLLAKLCMAETGLGDEFQPSVKASCVGGTMTIRVDTLEPFEGVVHGPNRTEPGCSVAGTGGLKTYLRIDLNVPQGGQGSCGVKHNELTDEYRVAIGVRAHDTIELLEDRLYVVTCGKAGFQNSRNEISVVQLKVTDGISSAKRPAVLEGSEYTLRAEVVQHDPAYGILVRRCFAFNNQETQVLLVDDRGCRAERLISEFTYDDEAGVAEAKIFSIFRMPGSNRTYFQCDVEICKGECQRPECDLDSKNTVERGNEDSSSQTLQAEDPFSRPQSEDTVTTSTSVFIAEPGSADAVAASLCTAESQFLANPTWLTYLAIAFGVLFGIMLLINIFLCSAMTCSCTKTEVIEKEPSLYDEDYSVYDSQYGYGGKLGPYSESEYGGSDYGGEGLGQAHSDISDRRGSRQGSHGGSRYME